MNINGGFATRCQLPLPFQKRKLKLFQLVNQSRACRHHCWRRCDMVMHGVIPKMLFAGLKLRGSTWVCRIPAHHCWPRKLQKPTLHIYPLPPCASQNPKSSLPTSVWVVMNLGHSGFISQLQYAICTSAMAIKVPRRSCSASLGKRKRPSPTDMALVLRLTNRAMGHLQLGPMGSRDLRFVIRMRNGGVKQLRHGPICQSVCKRYADMDKRKQHHAVL